MRVAKPGRVMAAVLLCALAHAGMAQQQASDDTAVAIVAIGHVHLTVPDVPRHREIWKSLGAEEVSSGSLEMLAIPGLLIMLAEGRPEAVSHETAINHVGFSVRDYAAYRARLQAVNADFFFDSEENGQILADLPNGVRVEVLTDAGQPDEIAFHHVHLAAPDVEALRDWYVEVLGAEPGERRGLPSAVFPGGRLDILPGAEPLPSQGSAIDHVGFVVADMEAFAERLENLGLEFQRAPAGAAAGSSQVFIVDPAGTTISIAESAAVSAVTGR